jgi:hypothetical protein
MPIHTIHVSWGRILIEECRRPEEALRILEACSRDVEVLADEDEKAEYCRLLGAARRSARLSVISPCLPFSDALWP